MKHKRKNGLTLLELVIVLTIIALIVAGVIGGSSLIKQAKLKSIISEADSFLEAISLFENKYKGLPGDLSNAFDNWSNNCATTSADCNGNGDGYITYSAGTTDVESFRAWQHLSLAGMVKGSYTGVATIDGQADIDINTPISNFESGGWGFDYIGVYAPPTVEGQFLELGASNSGNAANNPIMTPYDAYSIDSKIDDGKPRNGMLFGRGATGSSGCYGSNTVTDPYNLDVSDNVCNLRFVIKKY